jgi:ribosome-binding ATPase YchF (GTP1/OBG family)
MQLGIVGLPFSGRSTLFQAITKTHLDAAAMAKTDAHIGLVKVPDERLERCGRIAHVKVSSACQPTRRRSSLVCPRMCRAAVGVSESAKRCSLHMIGAPT